MPLASTELTGRLDELLKSMGVKDYDAGVLDALSDIARAEEAAVLESAKHFAMYLGRRQIDADAMRLACEAHQMLLAPVRQSAVDAARFHNASAVTWPLGPDVRVPLEAAAALRTDLLLREGAGRADAEAGGFVPSQAASLAGGSGAAAVAAAAASSTTPSAARIPRIAPISLQLSSSGSIGSSGAAVQLSEFQDSAADVSSR